MYTTLNFVSFPAAGGTANILSDMRTEVKMRVANGVDDLSAQYALGLAFRKFCKESEAFVYCCEQALSASDYSYSMIQSNAATPADYNIEVVRVKSAKALPNNLVAIKDFREIKELPAFAYEVVSNKQLQFRSKLFDLNWYDGGLLHTECVCTVPRFGAEFVKEVVMDFPDAIVYGACAELGSQTGRPWANGELYQMYGAKFQHELSLVYNITDTERENKSADVEG